MIFIGKIASFNDERFCHLVWLRECRCRKTKHIDNTWCSAFAATSASGSTLREQKVNYCSHVTEPPTPRVTDDEYCAALRYFVSRSFFLLLLFSRSFDERALERRQINISFRSSFLQNGQRQADHTSEYTAFFSLLHCDGTRLINMLRAKKCWDDIKLAGTSATMCVWKSAMCIYLYT